MPIHTKRWNDPLSPDDGTRILICRYRPRSVRKGDENWDERQSNLGPSRVLHAAFWGKHGNPIGATEYTKRYFAEMKSQRDAINALAVRVASGEVITLLCSSACVDTGRCHRIILRALVERGMRLQLSPPIDSK